MGYQKIITYILEEEHGSSIKASGWHLEADSIGGGDWTHCTRREEERINVQMSLFPEKQKYPMGKKKRYCKYLQEAQK